MVGFGRRGFVTGAAGLAALPAWAQGSVRLRVFWWGSKERADRTQRANEAFAKRNPGMTVVGETLEWGDYWTKLATQVAGRNAPDVMQMDYRYIFEYARRGALLPLDGMVPATLAIGDFGKAADGGRVDGKLYGVNLGQNSTATFFNTTALEAAGLKPPAPDATWDDYASLGSQMTKKAGRGDFWGLGDGGQQEPLLEVFLRQRGRALYGEDGKLGFGEADIKDWFGLWDSWRKSGVCIPAEVAALDKDSLDTLGISLGKAAIDFAHSNQLVALQTLNKDKLGLTMDPSGGAGAKPGQYLKPSQLLSVYARTRYPEDSAKLMNFMVEDVEGARLLGVERGIPASARIRAALAPDLNALDRSVLEYIDYATDHVGDLPPAPPKGAGEIAFLLKQVSQTVAFGRASPADAAKQFVDSANDILSRG